MLRKNELKHINKFRVTNVFIAIDMANCKLWTIKCIC